MANDRDRQNPNKKHSDQRSGTSERKRVIGKGMTSPDSTQVPLRAEDGEPDLDAIHGRVPPSGSDEENRSSRR